MQPKKLDKNLLIGKKTGSLEVISFAYTKRWQSHWNCICKCGKECVKSYQSLHCGNPSCGCKSNKDLCGQKFGKLTVLSYSGNKVTHQLTRGADFWKCQCDCGKICEMKQSWLVKGSRENKNCGCVESENNLIYGYRSIIRNYQRSAKLRKINFSLNEFTCISIFNGDCYYCNSKPNNLLTYQLNFDIKYNGIDRINNDIGYVDENVIPCCSRCNAAKNNMGYDEFITLVSNIHSNTLLPYTI